MKIKKYFAEYSNHCFLLLDNYSSNYVDIELLVSEALKDYPQVPKERIVVKVYSDIWKNHIGIEFVINPLDKLPNYTSIPTLLKSYH